MGKEVRKVHFVVSTHWDREWYESFQGFRVRLVNMFDELLEVMEKDPRFKYFQTDGQSIVLEDYLEIRPERAAKVRALVEEGRLETGPWYVLPDEFLVSGESLIRNIQEGIRVADGFGRSSRAGFVCDIFGHNSQIPQILSGFGIHSFFMWRGMNEKVCSADFRWRSPDGSEVLVHRFGPMWGYCDYDFRVRKANKIDAHPSHEELVQGLIEEVKLLAGRTPAQTLLVFDGGDHIEIEPSTPDLIEEANRHLAADGFQIEFSTLSRFAADIVKEAERITDVVSGELREPGSGVDEQWVIPGVLSSRIDLKMANRDCEDLLCYWAEPFSAIAKRYGLSPCETYLRTAWRFLLQNHPHDSICGCSIEQVHKDMEYRFDQSREIAWLVTRDSLRRIAGSVPGEATATRFPVVVANPLTFDRSESIDLTIELPSDCPAYQEFFGFERKPGFRVYDSGGGEIPYQLVHQSLDRTRFIHKVRKFPHAFRRHLVDISLRLDLPALGTRTLWVETVAGPTRHPGKGLATGQSRMENEFLSVEIHGNGTLTIQDLESGMVFSSLLTLEDCADIGDGWYHGVAVNDEVFLSEGSSASISMVHNGPNKATFRVEVSFEVPACFDFSQMVRSGQREILKVTHWITLRQGARRIEVTTEANNTIRDHRLRVLFPTLLEAGTYLADSPFDVVERPIELRADNYTYKELEVEAKPQYTWTAVSGGHEFSDEDEDYGLAVVSKGLPESAVLDTEDREIALTLLRAFKKAVMTDGCEAGQIQGKHCFNYWIIPFSGRPDAVRLGREGQMLAAGLRSMQVHPLDDRPEERNHPDRFSLLKVQGEALVTSIRANEDGGMTARLYNPTEYPTEVVISSEGLQRARLCDFLDQPFQDLPVSAGSATFSLDGKKILSVLLNR